MIRTSSSITRIHNNPRLTINTITKIHTKTHKVGINNTTQATQSRTMGAMTQINQSTSQPMMDSWNWTSLSQSLSKKSLSVSIMHTPLKDGIQRGRLTVREDFNFSMTSAIYCAQGSQVFTYLLFQRKLCKAKRKQLLFKRDSIS